MINKAINKICNESLSESSHSIASSSISTALPFPFASFLAAIPDVPNASEPLSISCDIEVAPAVVVVVLVAVDGFRLLNGLVEFDNPEKSHLVPALALSTEGKC